MRAWLAEPVGLKDLAFLVLALGVLRLINTFCTIRLKLTQLRIDLAIMRARHEMQIALERERRILPIDPWSPLTRPHSSTSPMSPPPGFSPPFGLGGATLAWPFFEVQVPVPSRPPRVRHDKPLQGIAMAGRVTRARQGPYALEGSRAGLAVRGASGGVHRRHGCSSLDLGSLSRLVRGGTT